MLIIAVAAIVFSPRGNELNFIWRYVQEVRAGNGFVFNPGERILLLPYPLLVILYALLSQVEILILACLLLTISLFLLQQAGRLGLALFTNGFILFAVIALFLMSGQDRFYPIGVEAYSIFYSLSLLPMILIIARRPTLAGIGMAIALFCAPLTLIGCVIAAYLCRQYDVDLGRYLRSAVIITGVGILLCVGYFGSNIAFGSDRLDRTLPHSFPYQLEGTLFEGQVIALPAVLCCNRIRADQTVLFLNQPTQKDALLMTERGDYHSMLIKYAPDTVLLWDDFVSEDSGVRWLWKTSIVNTIESERILPIGEFIDQAVSADFGLHLKLIGAGVDATSEEAIRVRLDWQIARAATQSITIRLRLDDGTEVEDTFEARVFRAGNYSTYHLLSGSRTAKLLHVTVMINDGAAGEHAIPLILN